MRNNKGVQSTLSGGEKKDADYYTKARKHAENQRHKSLNGGVSNRDFSKEHGQFKACCEAAGVDPSPRQASKFRNRHGAAFAAGLKGGQIK